ncbi:hypothetical protein LQE15_003678, partial [Proteus mirabilis]
INALFDQRIFRQINNVGIMLIFSSILEMRIDAYFNSVLFFQTRYLYNSNCLKNNALPIIKINYLLSTAIPLFNNYKSIG